MAIRERLASLPVREIGLLAIVAVGFGLGFGVVGWATAPLVGSAAAPAPTSRAHAVSAVPVEAGTPEASDPGAGDPGAIDAVAPTAEAGETTPAGDVATPAADASERERADPSLVEALRERHLTLPVEGIDREALYDSFDDPRSGGRTHRAIDIMAPRGTPVFAVEDGTIAKLDDDQGGGGTVVYQYDPERRFVYYYAHLESWAEGLEEGARVGRGQVIGYVGTTGNAPPGAPHLHFAITVLDEEGRWWGGVPIDPFGLF